MKGRNLGSGGLVVSTIGLGCMGMSQSYGAGDDDESIRTLHRAIDLGVTLIDTADAYGKGANETLVGRAIRDRRADVVLASKFGLVPPAAGGPATDVDGRPDRVKGCCEASLRRLGVDVIDLYYLHRVDPQVPIEDSVGAMADLVREGKVRFLGLSEAGPATLRRAHRTHPIAALQSEYSLWTREPERTVFAVCRELGIGFVPFSPLGRGFFGSAITDLQHLASNDVRRKLPRFEGDNLRRNLDLFGRLEQVARSKPCTTAQLALAWILAKRDDLVPIPGTKRRRYLEENVEATTLSLTSDDVAALDEAFPVGVAAGARYPLEGMRLLETEQAPSGSGR
jgi:aryl-alcohol dehydrogenase-like predicted oxidoreductase